jgi:pilus assembly protein CpaE
MNPQIHQTRVILICEPGSTQQQVTAALSSQSEFQLVDVLSSKDKLARQIRAAEPDVILLDNLLEGESTMDIIDDLALRFSDAAVVAILPSSDPLMAQQSMLAGARGFIVQPFTQVNLLSTLRRVVELELRRSQGKAVAAVRSVEGSRSLRSITVYSPRGGAGTTTMATNLAVSLMEETGCKVLLFEGKMFFGHLEVMLNLRTQNNVADLVAHAANLDESLLRDVIAPHTSGIQVLLAPNNIQMAQGIRPDDIFNIFVAVQRLYDIVVVDAGSTLNEVAVTLMDSADRIVLMTTPELASLQDASRFLQLSRASLAYPSEKILTVLNRAGLMGGVRQKDIESVLHQQLYAQIPDDEGNVLRSINRGIPLCVRYPRSPAAHAIRQMAKSLSQITINEMGGEGGASSVEAAQREVLLASSRMG